MARHYADAFAPEYQAATSPAAAVRDIVELEAMNTEGRRESVLFFDDTETGDKCDLKVYIRRRHMILSDFMPVLENCGLQVIAVSLFELREEDGEQDSSIYSFDIQDGGRRPGRCGRDRRRARRGHPGGQGRRRRERRLQPSGP